MGQPNLSNLFKRRNGANCLQTCLYPVGQRVHCQWVDVRYLICSQFIIWVLFRQQRTVKRQSPVIIKEMRANRKCWLPGLIYNYEHLLIASPSSQYLTVCHAMRLFLVCTRLSSHWCKKKKMKQKLTIRSHFLTTGNIRALRRIRAFVESRLCTCYI